jgi:hypothetical protein
MRDTLCTDGKSHSMPAREAGSWPDPDGERETD